MRACSGEKIFGARAASISREIEIYDEIYEIYVGSSVA